MEGPELEVGEACYYKDDEDGTSIDPDNSFSYLDKKIENVLGHFQKDFEGGVSAENLGAKFGGYGSFLPMYQRSPSIWSHPKSPQKVQSHIESRSLDGLPVEGATQNYKAPSSALRPVDLGSASCDARVLHSSGVTFVDVATKQDPCLPSSHGAEQIPLKADTLHRPVNPADNRTLKVRLKMGSDYTSQKNAAIYSGLGLDYSPSSSLGRSPEESSGTPIDFQENPTESPTGVLQIMTSFPIPGEILLSPLNDSFLCLTRKEALARSSKPVASLEGSQEHSVFLMEKSASMLVDRKEVRETKKKLVSKSGRPLELKNGNCMKIKNDMLGKGKRDNGTSEGKECLSNDAKIKPLSKSICDIDDSMKVVQRAFKISLKPNKDVVEGRSISSDVAKESPLVLTSDQDVANSDRQSNTSSFLEKIGECQVANPHKNCSLDLSGDGGAKNDKIYGPFKANPDVSLSKGGRDIGTVDPSKQMVVHKAASRKQDKVKVPHRTEKSLSGGKRGSKGSQSDGRLATDLEEKSFKVGFSSAPQDGKSSSHGVSSCKSRTHNLKLPKAMGNVRDTHRNSLGETISKGKDGQLVCLQKSSVDKKLISGGTVEEAPSSGTAFMEGGLTSEVTPPTVPTVVIEENWVCCDSCEKWRLLPFGTKPEQLPEKWLCSMLNWLPGMNRCDISEEETTKALNALYRLSVPENQKNTHNGAALGAMPSLVQQIDEDHHNLGSHALFNQVEKKHGSKEIPKNRRQEPVKSRRVNDMNQSPSKSNLRNKSSFLHSSTMHNLPMEKHAHKLKKKQINSGDAEQMKTKNKREADQFVYGASKRTKVEVVHHADKYGNSDHGGDLARMGLKSSSGFPTSTTGKNMQLYNACSSKDVNDNTEESSFIASKKQGDPVHISLDGSPLNTKAHFKHDILVKKRKLKDWDDDQNYSQTCQIAGHPILHTKVSVKKSGGGEYMKERTSVVSRTEGKESGTSKGDNISKRDGKVTRIPSSGSMGHPTNALEEVRSITKGLQLKKHGRRMSSQQTLDGVDSLKWDMESTHASTAATSSSSKVSGSRRSRASFAGTKGSPVESVSSSPFRNSNLEAMGKDNVSKGGLPAMGVPHRHEDVDCNGIRAQSDAPRKEEVSCVVHNEYLEIPISNYLDTDTDKKFSDATKSNVEPPENGNSHLVDDDTLEHGLDSFDLYSIEHSYNEDRLNNKWSHEVALVPPKSGCSLSVQSKYKNRSTSDFSRVTFKVSDSLSEQEETYRQKHVHHARHSGKGSDTIHCFPDKHIISCDEDEKIHVNEKDSLGKWSVDAISETKLKFRESDIKLGAIGGASGKVTPRRDLIQNIEGGNFSDSFLVNKVDPRQMQSRSCFNAHDDKHDTMSQGLQPGLGSPKGLFDAHPVGVCANNDVSKVSKLNGCAANQNGSHHNFGCLIPNGREIRDPTSLSPLRRGSGQGATDALKKARDLRDYADRLKSSGFAFESNEVYFQAALQYLRSASLSETCNTESDKHGEMIQMQIYGVAAKICESCALEYERCQEMAAAALAFKCLEVANMRIVYCKHSSTSRDRHELQATLLMAPHGESPSSSASDVDNLNNQTAVDKTTLSKGTGSHVAGNHIIAARNRSSFVRLLDFTQHVNFAMEASRKSQNAFAAANEILEETQNREGITSVKRVVDFSFQDIEGLVTLTQLAMKAISHGGFSGGRD